MSALIRTTHPPRPGPSRWLYLFAGLASSILAAFILMPGSIASKAHLALHGICAQRPSHSLHLGGSVLPLDARMTGIYLSAVVTAVWLVGTGNVWLMRTPQRSTIAVLAACVMVMAGDGLNALAFDLGLPHPYAPANELRLVTGVPAGTALGAVWVHLAMAAFATTKGTTRSVVGPAALAVPAGIALAIGALGLTGLPMLFAPFAVGLVVAVIAVVASFATIVIALATGPRWPRRPLEALAPIACAGLLAAVGLLAALAGFRLLLETRFNLTIMS